MPPVVGALSRVISPDVGPLTRALLEHGVRPTPGQLFPWLNRLEQAGRSIPLVGDVIKNARMQTFEEFNRGAINDALAPIGERLDPKTPVGYRAINEMYDKKNAAY